MILILITDKRTFDAKPEETSQTTAVSQSQKHAVMKTKI